MSLVLISSHNNDRVISSFNLNQNHHEHCLLCLFGFISCFILKFLSCISSHCTLPVCTFPASCVLRFCQRTLPSGLCAPLSAPGSFLPELSDVGFLTHPFAEVCLVGLTSACLVSPSVSFHGFVFNNYS